MKYFFGVIVLYTLLYYGFHAEALRGGAEVSFKEIFDFGYAVTIKPLEVLASIKDGLDEFIKNLIEWFQSLFPKTA